MRGFVTPAEKVKLGGAHASSRFFAFFNMRSPIGGSGLAVRAIKAEAFRAKGAKLW